MLNEYYLHTAGGAAREMVQREQDVEAVADMAGAVSTTTGRGMLSLVLDFCRQSRLLISISVPITTSPTTGGRAANEGTRTTVLPACQGSPSNAV